MSGWVWLWCSFWWGEAIHCSVSNGQGYFIATHSTCLREKSLKWDKLQIWKHYMQNKTWLIQQLCGCRQCSHQKKKKTGNGSVSKDSCKSFYIMLRNKKRLKSGSWQLSIEKNICGIQWMTFIHIHDFKTKTRENAWISFWDPVWTPSFFQRFSLPALLWSIFHW